MVKCKMINFVHDSTASVLQFLLSDEIVVMGTKKIKSHVFSYKFGVACHEQHHNHRCQMNSVSDEKVDRATDGIKSFSTHKKVVISVTITCCITAPVPIIFSLFPHRSSQQMKQRGGVTSMTARALHTCLIWTMWRTCTQWMLLTSATSPTSSTTV